MSSREHSNRGDSFTRQDSGRVYVQGGVPVLGLAVEAQSVPDPTSGTTRSAEAKRMLKKDCCGFAVLSRH